MRINVGCGQTPTTGWRNFDNSLSLRMARWPAVAELLYRCGLISEPQMAFIRFAGQNEIEYGDVRCRIPLDDGSVEVLYSSHMPEHLDHDDVQRFLKEAYRLLRPGGILRLAVPDLGFLVQEYLRIGDADRFIDATHLTRPRPRSLKDKILYIAVGPRNHQWLYDGPSLSRLLTEAGFIKVAVAEAGTTRILKPGPLNLKERYPESVYVEAEKPCKQGAEVSQKTGARSR